MGNFEFLLFQIENNHKEFNRLHITLKKLDEVKNDETKTSSYSYSRIDVDSKRLALLTKAMQKNTAITQLSIWLDKSFTGDAGSAWQQFCNMLANNKSFVKLTTYYIDDKHMQHLALAITNHQTITTLRLDADQLKSTGATYFSKALMHNKSIRCMDIGTLNDLSYECETAIAIAFQNNHSIMSITGTRRHGRHLGGKYQEKCFTKHTKRNQAHKTAMRAYIFRSWLVKNCKANSVSSEMFRGVALLLPELAKANLDMVIKPVKPIVIKAEEKYESKYTTVNTVLQQVGNLQTEVLSLKKDMKELKHNQLLLFKFMQTNFAKFKTMLATTNNSN